MRHITSHHITACLLAVPGCWWTTMTRWCTAAVWAVESAASLANNGFLTVHCLFSSAKSVSFRTRGLRVYTGTGGYTRPGSSGVVIVTGSGQVKKLKFRPTSQVGKFVLLLTLYPQSTGTELKTVEGWKARSTRRHGSKRPKTAATVWGSKFCGCDAGSVSEVGYGDKKLLPKLCGCYRHMSGV